MDKRRVLKSEKPSKGINTDKFPVVKKFNTYTAYSPALKKFEFNTYAHK